MSWTSIPEFIGNAPTHFSNQPDGNSPRGLPTVTARVISGVASHIQVEETEALHVSRIALMVRGYLRSECVK
ncbi:MAG: hypothetical protein BECKG1743D_GA0114223_101531, partial [Candidatus Kentron sp. G]